jgi:hypothetical protein
MAVNPITQEFVDAAAASAVPVEGETFDQSTTRIGSSLDSTKSALESILTTINQPGFSFDGAGADDITADSSNALAEDNTFTTNIEDLRSLPGFQTEEEFNLANTGLLDAQAEQEAFRQEQRDRLAERHAADLAGINQGFDVLRGQTEFAQRRETGATGQALARAGGFLGVTGSHQGVLQNLAVTHRQEILSLEAARQQALNAAKNAFEDRDFELADQMMTDARQIEVDIYNRSQDFQSRQLDLLQEQRAQISAQRETTEFNLNQVNDKIDRFLDNGVVPSSAEVANMAFEAGMEPDDVQAMFDSAKRSYDLAVKKEQTDQELAILDILLDTPVGTTVTIGGVEYDGLDTPTGTKVSVGDQLRLNQLQAQQDLRRSILQDDITIQEAVILYPELEATEIEKMYDVLTGTDAEQLEDAIEAGELDIVFVDQDTIGANLEKDDESFPITIDKVGYLEALETWEKEVADRGRIEGALTNDITIVYNGKKYRGPKSTAPSVLDYETSKSKAKIVED